MDSPPFVTSQRDAQCALEFCFIDVFVLDEIRAWIDSGESALNWSFDVLVVVGVGMEPSPGHGMATASSSS